MGGWVGWGEGGRGRVCGCEECVCEEDSQEQDSQEQTNQDGGSSVNTLTASQRNNVDSPSQERSSVNAQTASQRNNISSQSQERSSVTAQTASQRNNVNTPIKSYQKVKMHQSKALMEVTLMVKRGHCPKLQYLRAGKTRILRKIM